MHSAGKLLLSGHAATVGGAIADLARSFVEQSIHSGFMLSIRRIFHSRRHSLSRFSRRMAASIVGCIS